MPTMQRPRSISSATSSASTTANVCTQFWATCRPPSMSGTWQQINLSSCPNLLDHHTSSYGGDDLCKISSNSCNSVLPRYTHSALANLILPSILYSYCSSFLLYRHFW